MSRRSVTGRRAELPGSAREKPTPAAVREGAFCVLHALQRGRAGDELGGPGPWRRVDDEWLVAELSMDVARAQLDPRLAVAAFEAWAADTLEASGRRAADDEARALAPAPTTVSTAVLAAASASVPASSPSDRLRAALLAELRALAAPGVQVEELALPIDVHATANRLALSVRLGLAPAGSLSPAREAWLQRLLSAARARWRLVRFGRRADGAVLAEVDLSGAPVELLPALSKTCLAGLHAASASTLPSVALVLDRKPRRLLDAPPPGVFTGLHDTSPVPVPVPGGRP